MISSLLDILAIIGFSSFPLILWGYGSSYLSVHVWNRTRFIAGIVSGGISVGLILVFQSGLIGSGYRQIVGVLIVLTLISVGAIGVLQSGSLYVRGFLMRVIGLHAFLLAIMLISYGYLREYTSITLSSWLPLISMSGYIIAAYLEEGVKHISSVGLAGRDFRFSRLDLLLFTFFVTLGFVMVENSVYLIAAFMRDDSIWIVGTSRIIFALLIHVFASSICVMLWWKALSYKLFSWRYILYFILGFLIAIIVHSLYNTLTQSGHIILVILLSVMGYIAFTQWINEDADK